MRELYKEWYQESDRDFDKVWILEIINLKLRAGANSIRSSQFIYSARSFPKVKECCIQYRLFYTSGHPFVNF